MKTKSLLMIGISLVFGLVAAVGMSQVMGSKNVDTQPKEQTVDVLVAKEDFGIGDEVTEQKVELKKFPISLVPPEGAIKSMDEIKQRHARKIIKKGTILLSDNICFKSDLNEIVIPSGYAVSALNAGKTESFDGLIKPGCIIDIMGVFRKPQTNETFTRTFLKTIKVFAVNNKMDRMADDKGGKGVSIIQVLVTHKQAEKLALAQSVGQMKIILIADSEERLTEERKNQKVNLEENEGDTFAADLFGGGKSNSLQNFVAQQVKNNPPVQVTLNPSKEVFKMKIISGNGPVEYGWTNRGELPTILTGEENKPQEVSTRAADTGSSEKSEAGEGEGEFEGSNGGDEESEATDGDR